MKQNPNRLKVSPESRAVAAATHDFMRQHGISQETLAERIGRTQSYVSARLRGVLPIEMDMLNAVAKLSGMSLGGLLGEIQSRAAGTGTMSVPARQEHAQSRSRGRGARGSSRGRSV